MFKSINGGKLPTRGTEFSAGIDVYANEYVVIGAGETAVVPLGIAIYDDIKKFLLQSNPITFKGFNFDFFKKTHYISLKPRSSLRAKGLISHSAVIDLDYKDEIKMIIHNPIKDVIHKRLDASRTQMILTNSHTIKKGDRIGQLLLMEHKGYLFGIDSEDERIGGFGSTGE